MDKIRRIILPFNNALYWALLLIWGLLGFAVVRLIFLLRHWRLASHVPFIDIFYSFIYGLKFDLSVLAFLILPLMIISYIPFLKFDRSRFSRRIIQIIFYTVMALLFFLELVDIEYFSAFGDHLGILSYTYLDNMDLVFYTVAGSFNVILYIVLWAIAAAIFIFIATKFDKVFDSYRSNPFSKISGLVAMTAILGIGARGGISLAPIDWGSAYFSRYNFANDLSLNGVFTLSRSLFENYNNRNASNLSKYTFFPDQDALKSVQELVVMPSDSLLEPHESLKRLSRYENSDTTKYNVVFIIMESWSARFVGVLGGSPDATPFFDSLAEKSYLFDNMFASGTRTNRGLLASLCSFPSLPGRAITKLYGYPHPFSSISNILDGRGYDSYLVYGGDLSFDNIGGFFRAEGFKNLIGLDEFRSDLVLNKWGVPDHNVFERANEEFKKCGDKPFLGVVITSSNHEPFKVPDKRFEIYSDSVPNHEYLNTFYYSDWALGHFFHLAENESYYKNTIFVLVGDHSKILNDPDDVISNFRIASLIYSPRQSKIAPRRVTTICSQIDLVPTVLGMLGTPAINECWGRNILALKPNSSGYAFVFKDDDYGWIQDSLVLREKIGSNLSLNKFPYGNERIDIAAKNPDIVNKMRHNGRAFLQLEIEKIHKKNLDKK